MFIYPRTLTLHPHHIAMSQQIAQCTEDSSTFCLTEFWWKLDQDDVEPKLKEKKINCNSFSPKYIVILLFDDIEREKIHCASCAFGWQKQFLMLTAKNDVIAIMHDLYSLERENEIPFTVVQKEN